MSILEPRPELPPALITEHPREAALPDPAAQKGPQGALDNLRRIGEVHASEKPFEIAVTSLDVPLVGVIDLVADVNGTRTVVDFKTASNSYQDHEVQLSDQLTAYRLAEPDAERAALCVLVKTREPQIEWHVATRTGSQLTEYLEKVGYVGREIASGRFYKRTGM